MIVKILYHYFFILCYTFYIVNTIKINSSEVNQMDHTNNSCCCGEAEHFSGCLICGAPITYRAESSIQTCSICHKEQLTNAVCENSHFICDACHSYGTYAPVIAALRDSTEKDALLLLEKIMDLPSVHMHGLENTKIKESKDYMIDEVRTKRFLNYQILRS